MADTQADLDKAKADYRDFLRTIKDRELAGGEKASDAEKRKAAQMKREAEEMEVRMAADFDMESEMDAAREQARKGEAESEETRAKIGEAAKLDVAGQARSADAVEMWNLREHGKNAFAGDRGNKLVINFGAARQARELQRLGVTPKDIGDALRHGEIMRAERNEDGKLDVRTYTAGSAGSATDGSVSPVVPTLTAMFIYDYIEFIGGVRASGAEVYSAPPRTQVDFPVVDVHTAQGDAANPVNEESGTSPPTGRQDKIGDVTLTPARYAGITLVSEAMLQANVVGFAAFVARQLGRSVGRDLENDFHNAAPVTVDGRTTQKGLLNGFPTATNAPRTGKRSVETSGATVFPTRANYGKAMGMLDAGYHGAGDMVSMMNNIDGMNNPMGVRWLMDTAFFFEQLVAAEAGDGHLKYPTAERGIHIGRPVGASSFMDASRVAAANVLFAVVGNFFDGYLIAEDGTIAITYDTSNEFKSSRVVYKGECYSDGAVRDQRAFVWLRAGA